jgi:plastocyanin
MSDQGRTTHGTTQLIGLGLLAGALVFVVVMSAFVLDLTEDLVFMITVMAVAVAGALVVWRFDALWSRIVGIVVTLAVFMTTFWFAFGIFAPASPLEFVVGLAYAMGVILSLVGGVMAIVAGRRGRVGRTRTEQRLLPVIAGVLGIAAVVSVVALFATRTTVSDAEAAGAVLVEMVKFEFAPEETSVKTGGTVLLTNSDPFVHDFVLDELGIDVTVGPGSEALVAFNDASPGTYEYICSLHSDGTSGMMGTITINP